MLSLRPPPQRVIFVIAMLPGNIVDIYLSVAKETELVNQRSNFHAKEDQVGF